MRNALISHIPQCHFQSEANKLCNPTQKLINFGSRRESTGTQPTITRENRIISCDDKFVAQNKIPQQTKLQSKRVQRWYAVEPEDDKGRGDKAIIWAAWLLFFWYCVYSDPRFLSFHHYHEHTQKYHERRSCGSYDDCLDWRGEKCLQMLIETSQDLTHLHVCNDSFDRLLSSYSNLEVIRPHCSTLPVSYFENISFFLALSLCLCLKNIKLSCPVNFIFSIERDVSSSVDSEELKEWAGGKKLLKHAKEKLWLRFISMLNGDWESVR